LSSTSNERRLYQRDELSALLQLDELKVQQLVNTGQLSPIRICGEVRFDSRDVDQLIQTYKQISQRKQSYVH